MVESEKLFSVIVPTYNRSQFIGETICSLVNQTFINFEIIVVDDGSTDDTKGVVEGLKRDDSRIKYFYKTNGERGAARNFGIRKATGRYVTFIDSDDIAYSVALETAYSHLSQLGYPNCFVLGHEIRDKDTGCKIGGTKELNNLNHAIIKGNLLSCIGVFLKSEVLKEYQFDEDRKFSGSEDWLLWLKIGAKHTFFHHNSVCFCMYQHNDRSVMHFVEEELIYRAKHLRSKLLDDDLFIKTYGVRSVKRIYAHMLTYTSLHLAISGKKKAAMRYWFNALAIDMNEVFTRRTLGIFKKLLLTTHA